MSETVDRSGATGEPDGPVEAGAPEPGRRRADDGGRRRRRLLIGGGIAAVVVVAGVVTAVVLGQGDDDASPTATPSTVVLPSPTPTIEPVAREATTPFASALPLTVLQYALASSASEDSFVAAGALEAYTETYTDGGTDQAVVQAGQWETPEEATAFAQSLVAALPAADAGGTATATADPTAAASDLPQVGDVMVDGTAVGTFTIVDAGDGTGIAVWSNGTTVFRATAPLADIQNFYAAYPL